GVFVELVTEFGDQTSALGLFEMAPGAGGFKLADEATENLPMITAFVVNGDTYIVNPLASRDPRIKVGQEGNLGAGTNNYWILEGSVNPEIQIVKTAVDGPGPYLPGDTVDYSFVVTNLGALDAHSLYDVHVVDSTIGYTTPEIEWVTLAPGDSFTFYASYTIPLEHDTPSFENTATAYGTYGLPEIFETTITDVDTETIVVTIFTAEPSISITKVADIEIGEVGDVATYTIVVTNNGNVDLENIYVSDPNLGITDYGPFNLLIGESETVEEVTLTHTLNLEDLQMGYYDNTATAKVMYDQEPISVSDSERVYVIGSPAIQITKVADKEFAAVGDLITYTIEVTNTGNVELIHVNVVDELLGLNVDLGTLAPGASMLVTPSATYTVLPADLIVGSVLNVVGVTGYYPAQEETVGDFDEALVDIIGSPDISIMKDADIEDGEVGDTITYTLTVENSGNVPLTNVWVTDPLTGTLEEVGDLAVGDSVTLDPSPTYIIQIEDLWYGSVENTAYADGLYMDQPVHADDSESVLVYGTPGISVTKVADGEEYYEGDTITYTIVVINTGNLPLYGVEVFDDLTDSYWYISMLATGASVTVSPDATYLVLNADVLAEVVNNEVTAGGWGGQREEYVEDSDNEEVIILGSPSIELIKTGSISVGVVGDTVTYDFKITNTGNVTLTNVDLTDELLSLDIPIADLAPGQTIVITGAGSHVLTLEDLQEGFFENIAKAKGTYKDDQISDEDNWIVTTDGTPIIRIVKEASILSGTVGDVITYTLTVTNPGNVDLIDVMVVDDTLGLSYGPFNLAAGAEHVVSPAPTYTIELDDVYDMEIVNIAKASGVYINVHKEPIEVNDEDTVTVETYAEPEITIVKTVDNSLVYVGTTAYYTITVTNTGNIPLNHVRIEDPMFGGYLDETIEVLEVGESYTVIEPLAFTPTSVGTTVNTATATGWIYISDEVMVEDTDSASVTARLIPPPPPNYNPSISVTIDPDQTLVEVGTDVTFTMVVTNTGNTTLNNVTVDNPTLGFNILLDTPLYVSQSRTYTVVRLMDVVGIFNTQVFVEGISPQLVTVNDDDTTLVEVYEEEIIPPEPTPGPNPETGAIPLGVMGLTSLLSLGLGFTLFKKRREDDEE
ncbi:MAG: DUF11 domain-containing protein, partial [Clostridiales bacterium]|nr:DUF11 domain-containing protein [Clostridiales bacterium]